MGDRGTGGGESGGVFLRAQSPVTIRIGSADEENHSLLLSFPRLYLALIRFLLFTLHMIADSESRAWLFSVFF